MCEIFTMTSTPASMASFLMAASLSLPKGSESYSKVSREIFHSWSREKTEYNAQTFIYFFFYSHLCCCKFSDLKEPREHVGWLAPDDKKAGVEFAEVGVEILQTLEEKSEETEKKGQQVYYLSPFLLSEQDEITYHFFSITKKCVQGSLCSLFKSQVFHSAAVLIFRGKIISPHLDVTTNTFQQQKSIDLFLIGVCGGQLCVDKHSGTSVFEAF